MSTAAGPTISPSDYLARERLSETKHEYIDGEIVPMVGASREHNLIAINIAAELRARLRGERAEVYGSDMRVKVTAAGRYTYPDVSVVCGEPQFEDAEVDTLLNPKLIVEVLSASTEADDRGEKFQQYRLLDSLTDYLLPAQDEYRIEHFFRTADGRWQFTEATGRDGVLPLPSIGCGLPLAEAYLKVPIRAD